MPASNPDPDLDPTLLTKPNPDPKKNHFSKKSILSRRWFCSQVLPVAGAKTLKKPTR